MEIGSALVGLVIIGLCIVPFLLMNNSRKSREKQLLQALSHVADLKNCHIDEYETGRDLAIGLDRVNRTVCFYKNIDGVETKDIIRLTEVRHCTTKTINRSLAPDNGGRKVIERILLVFTLIEDEPDISWEIYNSSENIQLSGELPLAERWCQKVRQLLAETVDA